MVEHPGQHLPCLLLLLMKLVLQILLKPKAILFGLELPWEEFLDRYVFYDGKLIQVELITALLEDYAQPVPMKADERQKFLKEIFSYVK